MPKNPEEGHYDVFQKKYLDMDKYANENDVEFKLKEFANRTEVDYSKQISNKTDRKAM